MILSSSFRPLAYNKSIKQHSKFIINFYFKPNEFSSKPIQAIPKETLQSELPIPALPEWTKKRFQKQQKAVSKIQWSTSQLKTRLQKKIRRKVPNLIQSSTALQDQKDSQKHSPRPREQSATLADHSANVSHPQVRKTPKVHSHF